MNLQSPRSPEEAIKRWGPLAKRLSLGDSDLFQELLIELCQTVCKFEHVTLNLVQSRLLHCRLMFWRGRGKSIDNGAKTRREGTERVGNDITEIVSLLTPEPSALGKSFVPPARPRTGSNVSHRL